MASRACFDAYRRSTLRGVRGRAWTAWVRAALPAVKKEDVEVVVDRNAHITRRATRERRAKDGVLTIHVPKTKTEAKKPTTIKVQ